MIRYFTTNADSGSGSLRATIAAASAGDEIRPDPSVFTRGATITISLSSTIDLSRDVVINGCANRIAVDGRGEVCLFSLVANATFINVDFIRGYFASSGPAIRGGVGTATLKRCGVYGCKAANSSPFYVAALNCESCAFAGNLSANNARFPGGADVLNFCTSAYNLVYIDSSSNRPNCVITNVDVGFVSPPATAPTRDDWTADDWRDWDLRLLDDGSASPSSLRDSGTTTDLPTYDLDGNFRGRTTTSNGETVATCSPGAYETLQADLFWVGKDSTGAAVASPSFESADGWAASRFATVGGSVAPSATSKLFVDGDVSFGDGSPANVGLAVGGFSSVVCDSSAASSGSLTLGVGSEFKKTGGSTTFEIESASKLGDYSKFDGTATNETGAALFGGTGSEITTYEARLTSAGAVGALPRETTIGTFRASIADGGALFVDGVYDKIGSFQIVSQNDETSVVSCSNGATIRCASFVKTSAVELNAASGSAPLKVVVESSATVAGGGDFAEIEIATGSTSAALNLSGQKISGTGGAVSLSGSAAVAATGSLTATSLTLSNGASLTLEDGGRVEVDALTTGTGASLVGTGTLTLDATGTWTDSGATVGGVASSAYDASTSSLKIVVDAPCERPTASVANGSVSFASAWFASGVPFVVQKYAPGTNGANGAFSALYSSATPTTDSTADAYETSETVGGVLGKTVVDATATSGFNYYRIAPPATLLKGSANLGWASDKTRRLAVWVGDSQPATTYYYRGDKNGSFADSSDWSLTTDRVVDFDESVVVVGSSFVVARNAALTDYPTGALDGVKRVSVVFPSVVAVESTDGTAPTGDASPLISTSIPTPRAPAFYVGRGGTRAEWDKIDGATAFELETTNADGTTSTTRFETGSWTTGSTRSFRLDSARTTAASYRLRVAGPLYGGATGGWTTAANATTPLASWGVSSPQTDAKRVVRLALGYVADFAGTRSATVSRRPVDEPDAWTTLETNFAGSAFVDAEPPKIGGPGAVGEYVYRVAWNSAPNVWLDATAAPWNVGDIVVLSAATVGRFDETPTFAARLYRRSGTNALVRRVEIKSVRYSLFERFERPGRTPRLATDGRIGGERWACDVPISPATVSDALSTDSRYWSADQTGFNFLATPVRADGLPFFPRPGAFAVRITFETFDEGEVSATYDVNPS